MKTKTKRKNGITYAPKNQIAIELRTSKFRKRVENSRVKYRRNEKHRSPKGDGAFLLRTVK